MPEVGGDGMKGCTFRRVLHSQKKEKMNDKTEKKIFICQKVGERSYFDQNNNLKRGRDGMKDCTGNVDASSEIPFSTLSTSSLSTFKNTVDRK